MNELRALARLALLQYQKTLLIALSYLLLVHIVAIVVGYWPTGAPDGYARWAASAVAIASFPLLILTVTMFNFGDRTDLGEGGTSFTPWLLRTPIAGWKLAVVPIGFKSAWILIVCAGVALTGNVLGAPPARWLLPAIGFSTLAILACYVSWRPFRLSYMRLFLCLGLFVPSYLWFYTSVITAFVADLNEGKPFERFPNIETLFWIVGIAGLFGVTWISMRALRLARFNVNGIPSRGVPWWKSLVSVFHRTSSESGSFVFSDGSDNGRPTHALLRFDLAKILGPGLIPFAGLWLALIAFCAFVLPPAVPTVLGLMVLAASAAMSCTDWTFKERNNIMLPVLVAVAPMRSAQIAWTRQLFVTLIWFVSFSTLLVVALLWLGIYGYDAVQGIASTSQPPFQMAIPTQDLMANALLLGVILLVRQSTWSALSASTGRPRIGLYVMATKIFAGFLLLGLFLFRFLQFRSWDEYIAWTTELFRNLPAMLPWLLIPKLIIALFALSLLVRRNLTKPVEIVSIVLGYVAVTSVASLVSVSTLAVHGVPTWFCWTLFATVTPLSRILLAPVAMQFNRHRTGSLR